MRGESTIRNWTCGMRMQLRSKIAAVKTRPRSPASTRRVAPKARDSIAPGATGATQETWWSHPALALKGRHRRHARVCVRRSTNHKKTRRLEQSKAAIDRKITDRKILLSVVFLSIVRCGQGPPRVI
jgi:hypothetical protein